MVHVYSVDLVFWLLKLATVSSVVYRVVCSVEVLLVDVSEASETVEVLTLANLLASRLLPKCGTFGCSFLNSPL